MFYVFLHFLRSVLIRNLASVFLLPSDRRERLFLVHCTWPRRACLEKTLIDGLLPSHAASSSSTWRGNARVTKPHEPSEWEDNEPAAKPQTTPGEGGTPIHYLYGYVPPYGVVILKLLILNGVSISEAFSRTGYNISNARKIQFCKQPFEIIQGQIAFKKTVQCVNKQTLYSCCTLCFSVQGGRILAQAASKTCSCSCSKTTLKLLLIMKKHLFDV